MPTRDEYLFYLSYDCKRRVLNQAICMAVAATLLSADAKIGLIGGAILFFCRMIGTELGQRRALKKGYCHLLLLCSSISLCSLILAVALVDIETASRHFWISALIFSVSLSGLFQSWALFADRWHWSEAEIHRRIEASRAARKKG